MSLPLLDHLRLWRTQWETIHKRPPMIDDFLFPCLAKQEGAALPSQAQDGEAFSSQAQERAALPGQPQKA